MLVLTSGDNAILASAILLWLVPLIFKLAKTTDNKKPPLKLPPKKNNVCIKDPNNGLDPDSVG